MGKCQHIQALNANIAKKDCSYSKSDAAGSLE